MENEEKQVPDHGFGSESYFQYLTSYEGVWENRGREGSAVNAVTSIFQLFNDSASIASFKARDLFNMKGTQRNQSNSYAQRNYFTDNAERKAKELFIKSLNEYIRYLESFRWGVNKIATLYTYLLYNGLHGILSEIYIPEYMKETVDKILEGIASNLDNIIKEVQEYFYAKGNEQLNTVVKSMGRILLSQRSDQVINTLKGYDNTLTDEDWEYLVEKRAEFLRFEDSPELSYVKQEFGLSEGSYYRNLNQIISDLSERLDEDSLELMTELFLRD